MAFFYSDIIEKTMMSIIHMIFSKCITVVRTGSLIVIKIMSQHNFYYALYIFLFLSFVFKV